MEKTLKISQLIDKLNQLKQSLGDIPVYLANRQDEYSVMPDYIGTIEHVVVVIDENKCLIQHDYDEKPGNICLCIGF